MRDKKTGRLAAGLMIGVLAVSAFTIPTGANRIDADAAGPAVVSTQTIRDQEPRVENVSKNRKPVSPGRKVGSPTPPTQETLNALVEPSAAADKG